MAFYWWGMAVLANRFDPYSIMAFYVLSVYLFAFALFSKTLKPENLKGLVSWIRAAALVQLGLMGLQWFSLDPLFKDVPMEAVSKWTLSGRPAMAGFLDNSMISGTFLAVVSPFFLAPRWWVALVPLLVGIFLTGSEGSLVTALVTIGFTAWRIYGKRRWWRAVWVSGSLASAGAAAWLILAQRAATDHWLLIQGNSRILVWGATLKLIFLDWVNCLTGWGWSKFSPAFQGIVKHWEIVPANMKWAHTHNDYLQLWFETGLVGLLLAFGFVVHTLVRVVKKASPEASWWLGAGLSWLIVSFWSFPNQLGGMNVLGLVIWVGLWILGTPSIRVSQPIAKIEVRPNKEISNGSRQADELPALVPETSGPRY